MKVFPYILVAVVCAIVVPCLVTFCVNGKQGDGTASLERISTGRDDSYLQAQAVALRTKVYYAMGDATVIQASDLEFQYYTEEDYIAKWGRENYKSVKARYERAVIATKGKIIEQKENN